MDNKNLPAFPVECSYRENGEIKGVQTGDTTGFETGLTKREYFAATAPDNIPYWFVHTPVAETPQTPNWADIENKEDKMACRDWVREGTYGLPDHLKWFSDQFEKAVKDRKAAELKNEEARYFQWRKYYAEQMLAELNKQPCYL